MLPCVGQVLQVQIKAHNNLAMQDYEGKFNNKDEMEHTFNYILSQVSEKF